MKKITKNIILITGISTLTLGIVGCSSEKEPIEQVEQVELTVEEEIAKELEAESNGKVIAIVDANGEILVDDAKRVKAFQKGLNVVEQKYLTIIEEIEEIENELKEGNGEKNAVHQLKEKKKELEKLIDELLALDIPNNGIEAEDHFLEALIASFEAIDMLVSLVEIDKANDDWEAYEEVFVEERKFRTELFKAVKDKIDNAVVE